MCSVCVASCPANPLEDYRSSVSNGTPHHPKLAARGLPSRAGPGHSRHTACTDSTESQCNQMDGVPKSKTAGKWKRMDYSAWVATPASNLMGASDTLAYPSPLLSPLLFLSCISCEYVCLRSCACACFLVSHECPMISLPCTTCCTLMGSCLPKQFPLHPQHTSLLLHWPVHLQLTSRR